MLSCTYLHKISFVDVTDDNRNVNAVVYNMLTIEQVMTKNYVCVASKATV